MAVTLEDGRTIHRGFGTSRNGVLHAVALVDWNDGQGPRTSNPRANCNQRMVITSVWTEEELAKYKTSNFCTHCFPNGNPLVKGGE